MGIGFDASVIKHYEASKKRTIFGYVNACLISLRDLNKNNKLSVQIDGSAFLENPFMILVSNSNEMGYSMSLTPKASLQDGLLDVLIIAKLSRFKVLWLIVLMLFKKVHWLREAKSFQTKKIRLSRNDDSYFEKQIDGEYHKTKSDTLEISVQEKSLRVITTQ
jgi:diacylglycerol kinase family enzyme